MEVLILRDRKPGHAHQAEGVGRCIARVVPANLHRLDVRRRVFGHDLVLKLALKYFGRPSDRWLRYLYNIDVSQVQRPDVVVSSGRPTVAAAILLARHFGARFIFSGRISGYDLSEVTLMLVHSPRFAFDVRCALAPIPCVVTADDFPPPRELLSEEDLKGAQLSLLIGGKAHGYEYPPDEWRGLVRLVTSLAERFGVRWSVSTSRRSPPQLGDVFGKLAQEGKVAKFIDYRFAKPGSGNALFGADAVVVTEDSLSMMAEGVAAGRKVIALRPRKVADSYANEVVAAAVTRGGLAILPMSTTTPEHFAATLFALKRPTVDPRDMICDAVAAALHVDR